MGEAFVTEWVEDDLSCREGRAAGDEEVDEGILSCKPMLWPGVKFRWRRTDEGSSEERLILIDR